MASRNLRNGRKRCSIDSKPTTPVAIKRAVSSKSKNKPSTDRIGHHIKALKRNQMEQDDPPELPPLPYDIAEYVRRMRPQLRSVDITETSAPEQNYLFIEYFHCNASRIPFIGKVIAVYEDSFEVLFFNDLTVFRRSLSVWSENVENFRKLQLASDKIVGAITKQLSTFPALVEELYFVTEGVVTNIYESCHADLTHLAFTYLSYSRYDSVHRF